MPAPAVASLAKKAGVSKDEAERRWSKAKKRAEEEGRKEDWQYVMGIFKKMLGLKGESREVREANAVMEATVSAMIPMTPNPLEGVGPFSEEERQEVVRQLKTLFPNATEDAIQRAVFGGPLKPLAE